MLLNKINSQSENSSYQFTEGEEFIKDFFRNESIHYNYQTVTPKLKGDHCAYRVPDFYLPKYKVYVEFFGMWNASDFKKTEYREKKAIYDLNQIPCIYIYPENLGIIHYVFNRRLRAVLKKHNLKKELFRFNLKLFLHDSGDTVFGFALVFALLILIQFDRKAELFWQFFIGLFVLFSYQAFSIWKAYRKFFVEEYSYVNFMKE